MVQNDNSNNELGAPLKGDCGGLSPPKALIHPAFFRDTQTRFKNPGYLFPEEFFSS